MSYNETYSFEEGFELVQRELDGGTPPPEEGSTELPINRIRKRDSVFQPRDFDSTAETESHVGALMEAAKAAPNNRLDPITVWWSGKHWTVLDGHHRLLAYARLEKKGFKQYQPEGFQSESWRIPVRRFKGTLQQALLKATEENSKDKLSMTKDEKMNRAWRLTVAFEDMSKKAVARACKISERTVARMRSKLKEIMEDEPEEWYSECLSMSWREAQQHGESHDKDYGESWQERLAKDWQRRFGKTFGKKLAEHSEITARALELYSERLAEELGHWLHNPDEELEEDF
ncbi:hypothetical protein LG325_08635 [Marinobacter nauticus]